MLLRAISPRRFAPQHIELVSKEQDLCLQRNPRPKQSNHRRPDQPAKITHRKEVSTNSRALVSHFDFAVETTVARDVTRAKKVAVLDDIAGTCLDKGDEIDALGKLPEGEQRKLATAARAGEKVSAKARKPRQKDADTAVRTTTAEVDADPAASTERRKRAYAADEPEREAMTAKDAALREFDGHVPRLAQIINRAEPERFARTSVDVCWRYFVWSRPAPSTSRPSADVGRFGERCQRTWTNLRSPWLTAAGPARNCRQRHSGLNLLKSGP